MTITSDPESPEGQHDAPASSRRRPLLLLVTVLVVAAVAAVIWAVFIRSDDKTQSLLPQVPPGSVGTVPNPASATPDQEATELAALLEKGRKLTFHTTYKASGDPATTGDLSIEVWRKNGNIRQDTHTTTGSGASDTAGFVIDGKSTTCSKVGNTPWACSIAPDQGTNPDGIFGSTVAQLAGQDVTVTDDTIAGRKARCFSFASTDGKGKVCVTPEGLPLELKINEIDLLVDQVSTSVDDTAFVPPAPADK